MTGERKDKDIRGPVRRAADARGSRETRRAFRPLRWAWLLLFVALLAPAYDLFFPAGYRPPKGQRRTVVIERGQTLHEIARELQRVGVIKSQVGFLVLARAMRLDRSVKAGQYSFRLGITVPALLRALDRGMYGLNLVTIPEGLMVSETARLIQRHVGISASAIDSLARDPDLLDSLGVTAPSLEGWLAPDSYEWLPGTSPEVVLRTMVARTRERVQRATAGYDSLPLGMNAHEVLTLASIVEAESRAREERPRIARVYLNRLDRGMMLQADPTVGYALGRGPRSRLTFKDLRVVSPYNTYRHEGLPPGPICSPGAAAIEAVMNATPGIKDLYFVARGQGRHIFAPTYEQHLANIAFVRGKRAAAARADDDDVIGADADSGGARPRATPAPRPPKPGVKSAAPARITTAPPVAGTGAPASSTPLKGTLLIPRASIKAAGSAPLTPTLVKPAPATKSPAKPDTARRTPARATATGAISSGAEATVPSATPAKATATTAPAATGNDAGTSSLAKPAADKAAGTGTATVKPSAASTPGTNTAAAKPSGTSTAAAKPSGTSTTAAKPSGASTPGTSAVSAKPSGTAPAAAKPAVKPAASDTGKVRAQRPATKPAAPDTARGSR